MTIHVTVGLSLRHSLLTVNYTSMIISFLGLPFNGRSMEGKGPIFTGEGQFQFLCSKKFYSVKT